MSSLNRMPAPAFAKIILSVALRSSGSRQYGHVQMPQLAGPPSLAMPTMSTGFQRVARPTLDHSAVADLARLHGWTRIGLENRRDFLCPSSRSPAKFDIR